ncbi:MAG: hypothetical protein M1837_003475 [Sclerophora amabilis]|nr:MAG: hypothetical protein M1837_003475 [Sclerophora amabilis]
MPKEKKKGRWASNSLFGSKRNANRVMTEDDLAQVANDGQREDAATDVDHGRTRTEHYTSEDSMTERLRRGGSRILSMFRMGKKSGTSTTKASRKEEKQRAQDPAVNVEEVVSRGEPVSINASHDLESRVSTKGLKSSPAVLAGNATSPTRGTELKEAIELQALTDNGLDASSSTGLHERPVPSIIRHTKSTPGLSHRLSHKISSAFVQPTVVHRPNMRSRPSLQTLQLGPKSANRQSCDEKAPQDLSEPSSGTTGDHSMSAGAYSTPRTSIFSTSTERSVTDLKALPRPPLLRAKSLSILQGKVGEHLIEQPTGRSDKVEPSIKTVETAAAAKIFFETHFNNLLFAPTSPRSLRRRELELWLGALPLTDDQKINKREEWFKRETEHLRQSRALKSMSLKNARRHGVSVAGYEVVKILGKGSFGVVRLVREKEQMPLISGNGKGEGSQSTKGATKPFKVNTFDSLKTTFGVRPSSSQSSFHSLEKTIYAMKVIRKSDMLRNGQEGHLWAERDFLVASKGSRWIIPLIASFQDRTNLYLVMEYMPGGDFLGLLIRKQILTESETRWYISEMILCIEAAHSLDWIHRDVKPDNFLVGADGHLKISDFGLAFDGHWTHDQTFFNNQRYSLMQKLGIEIGGDTLDRKEGEEVAAAMRVANVLSKEESKPENPGKAKSSEKGKESILDWRNRSEMRKMAKSLVGTSQYMAPEVIRGEYYDGRCDWWSLGIILYECLFGFTPFCMENRQETKAQILHHDVSLEFPSDIAVGDPAINLIESLLRENGSRLSSKKYAVNDSKAGKRIWSNILSGSSSKSFAQQRGHYVFPNDAADIKAHPFFEGVTWDSIHLLQPPFIPKMKSWKDTRYFDGDEAISDVDDASSSGSEASNIDKTPNSKPLGQVDGPLDEWNSNRMPSAGNGGGIAKEGSPTKCKREKKRPRDKILRDREFGKEAMELRKKGSFIGYTYRSPKKHESGGTKEGVWNYPFQRE